MTAQDFYSPVLVLLSGLIILENPASSLTFHDPLMMSWIESEAPFCAQVASCMVGASFSKSWMFVSNQPCILDLACSCSHPPGTHTSFVDKRDGSGFLSRRTAEYPDELASSLAGLCIHSLPGWAHAASSPVGVSFFQLILCGLCILAGLRMAGAPPAPLLGWCLLLLTYCKTLRRLWSHRLFNDGLCLRIAAHLQLSPKEPPLSDF